MVTLLHGYGAHGRDIEAIFRRARGEFADLLLSDDDPQLEMPRPEARFALMIGVNDPKTRRAIAESFGWGGAPALIDPSVIGRGAKVAQGCVVAPGVVMLQDVVLGRHVHVNYGVTMTRTRVGAFSTICPGVTIAGDVVIGEECLIGAGAVICDRVTIGNRAVIGAGALVLPQSHIPGESLVLGMWKS